MTGIASAAGSRPGVASLLLLGLLLLLLGVPFAGMALMASFLLTGRGPGGGIPFALVALAGVFFLTDFLGALLAAVGSGVMALTLRTGRDLPGAVGLASGAVALASIAGLLLLPDLSLLSPGNIEMLMQVYAAAGLSPEETGLILEVFLFTAPALLALWAVGGTVAAGAALQRLSLREGEPPLPGGEKIRMGLVPAWIMILCLGVNLVQLGFPSPVRQGALNTLLFLALPYLLVGLSVARAALRSLPGVVMPAAFLAFLLPPVAIGILILLGITDTLFDFRLRLAKLTERTRTT